MVLPAGLNKSHVRCGTSSQEINDEENPSPNLKAQLFLRAMDEK